MKAEDLRIGNYYDSFGTIQKMSSYSILELSTSPDSQLWAKPIQINEDWLLKFGFNKYNNGDYWINLQTHYLELIKSGDLFYPIYAQMPEMSGDAEQSVCLKNIQYVHQLQNLYFAITGENLTLV